MYLNWIRGIAAGSVAIYLETCQIMWQRYTDNEVCRSWDGRSGVCWSGLCNGYGQHAVVKNSFKCAGMYVSIVDAEQARYEMGQYPD